MEFPSGPPLHRENGKMAQKIQSGRTQRIWKFCQNFPIFSYEKNASAKSVLHMKHPQITEIGTGDSCEISDVILPILSLGSPDVKHFH